MARDRYGYYREEVTEMRIGDPERDVTRDHLAWAFSNGYIDRVEFDTRSGQVNEAKVQTSLDKITSDLPRKPAEPKVAVVVKQKSTVKDLPVLRHWLSWHPSFRALSFLPVSGTLAIAVPVSMLANHPNPPMLIMFIGIMSIVVGASTALIELIYAMAHCDD